MAESGNALTWLLEEDNPSLMYRALTELLGVDPADPRARAAKELIPASAQARAVLDRMHPDGCWRQRNPRSGEVLGDGVEYGAFATTHFCLAYLAELGFDRQDPRVAKAADRYLALQQPDGDFWRHFSCLYAYNIRTFLMLSYDGDPRLGKTIDLLLNTRRPDGGYLCDMHEGKPHRKKAKSCIRGSAKALLAFSMLPELWGSDHCRDLVGYFLRRDGIFRTEDRKTPVNKDVTQTIFPIHWRAGLLEILLALSKMGYGRHPELDRAWAILAGKRTDQGKYILDWTPAQALLPGGKRGTPSKWVTFYALLALKYRDSTADRGAVEGQQRV